MWGVGLNVGVGLNCCRVNHTHKLIIFVKFKPIYFSTYFIKCNKEIKWNP